jgi:SAM-dependent methyltransferase
MNGPEIGVRSWWQRLASRLRRRPARDRPAPARLVVPEKFNRNSPTVVSLMSPEQSGLWLLERMRERIGLGSYARIQLLDYGCGVRFTQALVNTGTPIGRYVGIDCFGEMIDFLRSAVTDPRFSFHTLDVYNPMYNPGGRPLSPDTSLPVASQDFDVISLFSVITHQYPHDSECLFSMLRRYVAADGHLFFTCFLDSGIEAFEDRSPDRNAGRCVYRPDYLVGLIERCGWRVVTAAAAQAPLIGESFVLRPA